MISAQAQSIRSGLERDTLDMAPIALKREQWEEYGRAQPTPFGTSTQLIQLGGVSCLLCAPDHLKSRKTIVYCHGGGLVEGSIETHRNWTCRLALHTGCNVLSVDYRLAPEHPYPAAVHDVLAVCNALHSSVYFSKEICFGADSTGCILALAAMNQSILCGDYCIDSAFLLSPSIDLTFSGASIKENATAEPLVSLDVLKHCSVLYAGDSDMSDPGISPLFAHWQDTPPVLLMADAQEILLDDSTRFEQKISEAGGTATLHIASGLWHAWPLWGEFPESTAALELINRHVNKK